MNGNVPLNPNANKEKEKKTSQNLTPVTKMETTTPDMTILQIISMRKRERRNCVIFLISSV